MQRNDANTICRGRYWFVRDSLGICCAVFTWLLMLYAEFVISAVVLLSDIFLLDRTLFGLVNLIGFNVVFTLAMVAHLRCVFSEPGIVARNNFEEEVATGFEDGVTIRKCVKCESVKPERAHHCSVCNRCVHKMDHHCPWVNNCVGESNQKFFVLFTLYIALMSLYAILIVCHHFVICVDVDFRGCSWLPPAATVILLIIVLFEGILFFLFTAAMCGTQMCSIWGDETTIESLKGRAEVPRTWIRRTQLSGIRSVFGARVSIDWLSPLSRPRLWWREKLRTV